MQLQHMDALIEMGIEGIEVWHSGLSDGAHKAKLKPRDKGYYLPKSFGTTKTYYEEIKNKQLNRW